MISPRPFVSYREHLDHLADLDFWRPHLDEVLRRHGLAPSDTTLRGGIGGTYPTFLHGEVVVKLFGYGRAAEQAFLAERAAFAALAQDPEIAAPRLLGEGRLFDDPDQPWPYLIISRVRGRAWRLAELDQEQKLALAAQLGGQVRRLQSLPTEHVATHAQWARLDVRSAVAQTCLPPHLIAQVDGYLAALSPPDPVFVHGDIGGLHVFVREGRLSGIIDWGDAIVADRHYELAQMHLTLFKADKALLAAFLDAAHWPVADDFARNAFGYALHRQAVGLAQHHTMDVFFELPGLFPLVETPTLEDVAERVFAL